MELTVNGAGSGPPYPSERRNEQQFECPLCVDIFQQFSQLKFHLLTMHPRRDMIMELVKERYGVSILNLHKGQPYTAQEQLTKGYCCWWGHKPPQRLPSFLVSFAIGLFLFLHSKISGGRAGGKVKKETRHANIKGKKMWPSDDSSSWDSHLPFCVVSSPVTMLSATLTATSKMNSSTRKSWKSESNSRGAPLEESTDEWNQH